MIYPSFLSINQEGNNVRAGIVKSLEKTTSTENEFKFQTIGIIQTMIPFHSRFVPVSIKYSKDLKNWMT